MNQASPIIQPGAPAPAAGQVRPAPAKGRRFRCERKPGGLLLQWELIKDGYLAISRRGVKFLQRFHEWGVASVGAQKELIFRVELALRPVETAGLLHLELFNPDEARLWLLNLAVWRGWNLFFIVNLGARLTSASQTVRAQKMRQVMLEKAKREQAERIQARRIAQQVARHHQGRPWPQARAR